MSDQRSDDRDNERDYRREDGGDDRVRHRGDDRGDDHCDDHGQATAQVSAITALSADTGASHSDFITSQALQTVSGTFTGTLKPGEIIQVSADGGAHWISASVSGNSWSASGVTLIPGSGTLITRTIDSQHQTLAGASHAYVLDALAAPPSLVASFNDTGASASDGITSANKATLSGTAEAGAAVKVYDGATLIATVTAAQNGAWTLSVKGLADGTHAFTAVQTDIAGNTSAHSLASTMTVDTTVVAPTLVASFVDSGVSASDGITNATSATLSGMAEAGATVKVYDGSKVIGTVTANAVTGAWSLGVTGLQDGTHNFSAKQTDLAGNVSKSSDASTMTVDTVAPSSAPTLVASFLDTGISHTDKITSATTVDLSGKADKGALVQIYDGAVLVATVTAGKNGVWSYTLTDLPNGAHSFTAAQSDLAGNLSAPSAASSMTVITGESPPGVGLVTDTGISQTDHITSNDALKGTAAAGAAVTISEGATTLGTTTADGSGNWTFTPSALAQGTHALTVTAVDSAGNTASSAFSFTLDTSTAAPAVALVSDTGTSANDHITSSDALKGMAEAGATVTIYEGSTVLGTAITDSSGHWSFTPTPLIDGAHALTFSATDVAGNTATSTFDFTLDTSTAVPTIALSNDTGASAIDGITCNDALKGAAEAGATVTVKEGTNTLGTAIADSSGNWTLTPAGLTDGTHTLTVSASDVAGNVSAQTGILTFTLDTHTPALPTVQLVQDSGVSPSDGITNNDALTGTAEAGATVTVTEGTTALGTATADSSGHWTLTPATLPDGAHTLTVTATDVAGNTSAAATLGFTLDTSIHAPTIAAVDGTLVSGGTTADTTPTLSGTADPGTSISVYDGSTLLGSTTANASTGAWSYTHALTDGTSHSLTVQSVDLAGNASASGVFAVTVNSGNVTLFGPVLTASLPAANYADSAAFDTFNPVSGSLSATETGTPPGTPHYTFGIAGSAPSSTLAGYDTAEAGHYGTLYLNSTGGAYTYVPDSAAINALPLTATFAGDSFALTVADGLGGTGSAALTINVSGANDTPVLSASLLSTSYADTAANDVFAPVTGTLTTADPDTGATHVYSATGGTAATPIAGFDVATAGTYGTLYLNSASGAYEFAPNNAAINALPGGANGQDSFTLAVSDGLGGTSSKSLTINVTGANDTPALTASVPSISYTDTAAADVFAPVNGVLSAADRDAGATYAFGASGAVASSTVSGFNLSVAGTYGTLYLNSASGAYQFAPNSAAINALPAGDSPSETFTLSVAASTSGGSTTASLPLTVHLAGATDASVIGGVGPFDYTIGSTAAPVAPNLTLSNVDSVQPPATSATAAISFGFSAGNDQLTFSLPNGSPLSGSYNSTTGVLTFTGTGTLADYQAALDSVHFSTTTSGARTVSFTVFDQAIASITVDTSTFSLNHLTTTGFRVPGTAVDDFSGFSVSTAGDINGDGFADVIIGAPFADGGTGAGAAYVIYGHSAAFPGSLPVSSLDGTNGFRISGANTYDALGHTNAFGSSVSSAGDVNGDGYADLIIGAPRDGSSESGVSYVVFGHGGSAPFGSNLDLHATPLNGSNGFSITGVAANDWAGYAVSSAGDVNGDGFSDMLIGAHYAQTAGVDTGAAYVVFGGAQVGSGGNIDLSSLNGTNGFSISPPAGIVSVNSVGSAGDVNGDGFGDLIIATTHLNADGSYSAEEFVVFGHAKGTPFAPNLDLTTLNGSNGFSITGAGEASRGQHVVSTAGDVNGDGFADLIIGSPYATTANGVHSGAAYVLFGKASGFSANVDLSNLTPSQGFMITGKAAGDWAGYSVKVAGDVNGDGYADMIIGAPKVIGATQVAGQGSGESYLIFGQAPGLAHNIDLSHLSPSDGFALSGVGNHDASGYAVSAAGDVNGDGFADLIVGAAYASPGGVVNAGESYVVFGSQFIAGSNTFVGSSTSATLTGTAANDHFIAGSSSDTTMIGNGGVDSFSGGAGNDTIHVGASGSSDSRYLTINGGGGVNTLVLDGTGMALNLTAPGAERVSNIEHVDLGSGNNSLVLNIHDVLNMSGGSNQLFVTGQAGDSVSSLLQGWAKETDPAHATVTGADGHVYDSYTIGGVAYTQGMANLLVDHNLLLANAAHLS